MSAGGIGLRATWEAKKEIPSLDSRLNLEFALPASQHTVRVRGRVAWVDAAARESESGDLWLGVQFIECSPEDRTAIVQHLSQIERSTRDVESRPQGSSAAQEFIVNSAAMRTLVGQVRRISAQDVTVLIEGETGTGKEEIARLIHRLSRRAGGPFVVVDVGSLPDHLLESELFGYVKGAFTGASEDRPGLVDAARGGTLFLDEIQNATPAIQAKLLRLIDRNEVRRVGGRNLRRADARLIVAANHALSIGVVQGRFRDDLLWRLDRLSLRVPPLRERRDDILPLAEFFLTVCNARFERRIVGFSDGLKDSMRQAEWPGNVRQLRNFVERAVLFAQGDSEIGGEVTDNTRLPIPDEVPRVLNVGDPTQRGSSTPKTLRDANRVAIRAALDEADGNQSKAAAALGVNRNTLARQLKKLGLRARTEKPLERIPERVLPTALVVEDDRSLHPYITRALSPAFDVVLACDAGEAIGVARSRAPVAVFVIDYLLPGRDGLSLYRDLRDQRLGGPAIFVTGTNDRAKLQRAEADGLVARVFWKPCVWDEIAQFATQLVAGTHRELGQSKPTFDS